MDEKKLKFRLETVRQLIPYIKRMERERRRLPAKSRAAYDEFFASEAFDRLFDELIVNKLAISQITTLLKDKPLSTGEMAEILGLNPSDLPGHIHMSSRHGFMHYDADQKNDMLA